MKLRIISTFLVVSAVTVWAAACNVPQARPVCLVGHGTYAAKYTLKAGQTATGACTQAKGEMLGIQKYNRPPTAANPDPDQTIAIKTATLTGLSSGPVDGQAQTDIISQGKLSASDPDANNFCTAPSFNTVHDVEGGTDIAYAFSNVKFYVTPQIPGTQFTAELAYTEGGCTANYDVTAVFPSVSCDNGAGEPDASLCALPDASSFLALNPDFPVTCDPDLLLCVLSSPVPALKAPSGSAQQ